MEPLIAWLQASAALGALWFAQPFAAYLVGRAVGGYKLGTAKNKTALAELWGGALYGVGAGLAVWAVQRLIIGGA